MMNLDQVRYQWGGFHFDCVETSGSSRMALVKLCG